MALRESGEDYLESIYVLSERQGTVRSKWASATFI